jgi:hypothetical protein
MLSDDDLRTILRNIRLIASHCFDLTTFGRLRLLADQIEQKIQQPTVPLAKIDIAEDQGGPSAA